MKISNILKAGIVTMVAVFISLLVASILVEILNKL